jgi:hypothetical protein
MIKRRSAPKTYASPWLSIILLLIAYTTFSHFLTKVTHSWWAWGAVLAFTWGEALLLTTWFDGVKFFFARWLKSDVGYFSLIIVGALSVTMALVWFKIFGYFVVLLSAEVLAKLDLQNARFSRLQSLLVLESITLVGLAVGWWIGEHPTLQL